LVGSFLNFAEGPLLWIIFILFCMGILLRTVFFVCNIYKSARASENHFSIAYIFVTIIRALFPFHNASIKKPLYVSIRYIFHLCMFAVPIWFSGHVYMWEESRFEWYWTPMADHWADRLTLVVLFICGYFFIRRIIVREIRRNSSISDYIIIILTFLPFLTGYLYTAGSLDYIPFFESYMWYFHVLSGEAMLLMIVVLFCRTRLNIEKCVGCAACESNCPTQTLESKDEDKQRIFTYSHYQCICCASCVNACPEDAAELRHEIGVKKFFQVFSKKKIRAIELSKCEQCDNYFAPTPQLAKLGKNLTQNDIEMDMLNYCGRCKKISTGKSLIYPALVQTSSNS